MSRLTLVTPELQERYGATGRIVALVGSALLAVSIVLPWAYTFDALDGMNFSFYPSPLQILAALLGAGVIVGLVLGRKPMARRKPSPAWNRAARGAATGALVYLVVVVVAIAAALGGLVNVDPGGWLALVGAALAFAGTRLVPAGPEATLERAVLPGWAEILAVVVLMAASLVGIAYALNQRDGGTFIAFGVWVGGLLAFLIGLGVMRWFSGVSNRHKRVLILSAFVVAFLFPFTQNGSDANMSIATQIIVFAATALGLNIVVGLAGLLDLGYIAFLGAGAFTAAILSRSAFATAVSWEPPFIVIVLISGLVSASLGLLIGSPTLRVSGDYLAIVTLAFGEIFRITMINLDGEAGPNLTRGSNGIPAIPDLNLFGFDFGQPHVVLGIPLGRFSNYFFLLLLVVGLIILVFSRLNASRIGRGWVAIREDEKAAEAMGVNVFGLKLFAFACGAFLAGVAGSVKAHVDVSVTPDQYVFLESAFLLAAIVLGGMGTVVGVLAGATVLELLPEKLRAFSEYRLMFFGLLLILMMRFRPEGIIASKRRQLEFHDDDEELAEKVDDQISTTGVQGVTT